jgi:hypothetical protein
MWDCTLTYSGELQLLSAARRGRSDGCAPGRPRGSSSDAPSASLLDEVASKRLDLFGEPHGEAVQPMDRVATGLADTPRDGLLSVSGEQAVVRDVERPMTIAWLADGRAA